MSEAKFTKGPWEVGSHEIIDGAMDYINIKGPDGYHISKVSSREEYRANAHLIAAAPELYDALELLKNSAGWSYMTDEMRGIILAALAKARGEV